MIASRQHIHDYLPQVLGQALSEAERSRCLKQAKVVEPTVGQVWQSGQSAPMICIILAGKVRLLDSTENLVMSLLPGMAFGALTLFPEQGFQPLSARASVGTQLCYIPQSALQPLIQQHTKIQTHLYQQAISQDLQAICRCSAAMGDLEPTAVQEIIEQRTEQQLQEGKLPVALTQAQFWLLRQGELVHSSGQRMTGGHLYPVPRTMSAAGWQVTRPTQLFVLNPVTGQPTNGQPSPASKRAPDLTAFITSTSAHADRGAQLPPKSKSRPYFPNPTVTLGQFWHRLTKRYPFTAQQSAMDCGVACLVMIGRHWGKRFSINHLRQLANVSRDGTSLRGLMIAAEYLGFSPRPVQAELSQLKGDKLPAILHWQGNHYVVAYRITRRRVHIADPAVGRLTLRWPEVQEKWSGYTLLLKPTPSLKRTPDAKNNFWKYLELLKPHWFVLLEILVAAFVLQLLGLVTPLFTQLLLDRVVVQRSTSTLMAVGVGLMIFSVFRVIMSGLRRYLIAHTGNKIDLSLVVGFINHAFQLPLSYFESRYVGDVTSRLQEARKIRDFLTGEALSVFLDIFTVFIYAGFMFWYNWQMSLLGLTVIPVYFLITLISAPILRRISREIFNTKTTERSYLIEALSGINTVKAMGLERSVRWRWEDLFNISVKVNFSGKLFNISLQIFSDTVDSVVTAALLWFGAWQVIQGQLTVGQLVAFNMLLGNVIRPLERFINLWDELQEVFVAAERMNDVIDTEPEEDRQQLRPVLPAMQGAIAFEQVTFRYSPESETNTLENLSFSIEPGQTFALVGRSGSGKTTVSKLVLGLYPPNRGRILVDGYDIATISLRSLRRQIGVVNQDTFLFGGTIQENISIAYPAATLDEIRAAAKLAGADEFIQELPLKYQSQIGEGGGLLSGGQRQRVAIARALLSNPRLLVLDEATSNLDAESERIIQTNLNTIRRNRTTLIIAHRLSTVRNADQILVLDHGVLMEQGTHSELMAKQGQYFYLNQQQLTAGAA
jgi:ATP-binding cassette, subfamily B, bacterial HlyB/CyaB